MSSDNVQRHKDGHAAFSRGDMEYLSGIFADDIMWHVAGQSPVSGDYEGKDAVFDFFARLMEISGNTLEIEDQFFMGDADRTVALFKLKATRDGRVLDHDFCEVVRWENGKVAEDWGFAFDQYSYDEFWS